MHCRKLKLPVSLCVCVVVACSFAAPASATGANGSAWRSGDGQPSSTRLPRVAVAKPIFGNRKIEPKLISDVRGVARAFRFHNARDGVATSIIAYVAAGTTARRIEVALYTNRGGHPGVRLATGRRRYPQRARWSPISINPAVVQLGRSYWIVFLSLGGHLDLRGRTGDCRSERATKHLTSLPARWKNGRLQPRCRVSAYVIGQRTPGGGATSPVGGGNAPTGPTGGGGGAGGGSRGTGCSPTSSETMTNSISHLCGFADTTNTGVPAGATLYRVPQDITGPTAQTGYGWSYDPKYGRIIVGNNGLVTNVQVNGDVEFDDSSGGTVQDSDIETSGDSSYAVQLRHANNVTIKDNNIHGPVQTPYPDYCDSGIRDIYGDALNMTVENNNIWYCATPMNNIINGGLISRTICTTMGTEARMITRTAFSSNLGTGI